tara:strand:+ start:83 stop:994 length:912 start_codon:yes stop_codon:yes gene_type:complete
MTANSSTSGLLLEYTITRDLINNYNLIPDKDTIDFQIRDKKKIDSFNKDKFKKFSSAAIELNKFLSKDLNFLVSKTNTIKRLPDKAGKDDFDVTDIEIGQGSKITCISIKNNNESAKHPRPEGLMQSIGFIKDCIEDNEYREELESIKEDFKKFKNNNYPKIEKFPDIEKETKYKELYLPICELYSKYINLYGSKKPETLFKWFSGSRDYLKIIVWSKPKKDSISIQNYDIESILPKISPLKINSYIKFPKKGSNNPYIYVEFSNGWIFEIRLKTDSSEISRMKTKFDVKHHQGQPKKYEIKF